MIVAAPVRPPLSFISTSLRSWLMNTTVMFILRVELGEDAERHIRTLPYKNSNQHVECGARGTLANPMPELLDLNYKALAAAFDASFKQDQPTNGKD